MTAKKATAARPKATTPRKRKAEAPSEVKISAAKGRPMLSWVGKRPLQRVTAFPAQHVETFDPTGDAATRTSAEWQEWPAAYPRGGLLFHGDNKEVLAHLLASGFRGKVDLIYIDPPFDSGADYVRRVQLRGPKGKARLDGEGYTLGEQIQYEDIWANDAYLQFMFERLLLLRELLTETGSLYLHCDFRRSHQLRCLLDEVFGAGRLVSEVIWHYSGAGVPGDRWASRHDTLLWYAKNDNWFFNPDPVRTEYAPATQERFRHQIRNIRAGQDFGEQQLHPLGKYPEDVLEVSIEAPSATARTDYPTQKPRDLLRRLILASSLPGQLVLDCFVGSGTAPEQAQVLGRRWIGCDINKGAIQTTAKRLQDLIEEQIGRGERLEDSDAPPTPTQLSFTTWRVNDYDLQIQHSESVALACEHLGVERSRTDRFFDGMLANALVKIVPFTHPLSPADLQEVRTEIEARPDDEREIRVVCLGIELAAQAWLEEWNRYRRGRNAANRIEAIELRTDERYGAFLAHEPAQATVRMERRDGTVEVDIEEFVSPSILARLAQQTGVVQPRIDDWRSMVDSVMIDTSYDGEVFNVVMSDVPERKTDFVAGKYELPAQSSPTVVAVKITDMLGEEMMVTREV